MHCQMCGGGNVKVDNWRFLLIEMLKSMLFINGPCEREWNIET